MMEITDVKLQNEIIICKGDALLVIDIQNDFLPGVPGGALAVNEGDYIIENVNNLMEKFYHKNYPVILTQDWHPPGHASFASAHPEKSPLDPVEGEGIGPVLWPDHCVQGTEGANFSPSLKTGLAHLIIRKGFRDNVDSYSAFLENDKVTKTGLEGYLQSCGVNRVFTCGLALDYCVFYSAIDARRAGFDVIFVLDLTKPVGSPEGVVSSALTRMVSEGINFCMLKSIQV